MHSAGVSEGTTGEGLEEALEGCYDFLHWRAGQGVDVGVQTARGPDVDEAEIPAVHTLSRVCRNERGFS